MPRISPHKMICLNGIATLSFNHNRRGPVGKLKVLGLCIKRALIPGQGQFLSLSPVHGNLDIIQYCPALLFKQTRLFSLNFPLNKIAFCLGEGKVLNSGVGRFGVNRRDRTRRRSRIGACDEQIPKEGSKHHTQS